MKCLAQSLGSSVVLKMQNGTNLTNFYKSWRNQEILGGPSEVRRQAPFEWSSRFLWTFLSCFHIKRHERGSKKQDSQPPIPLPWVTAVCSSRVLSRNNQDYRQSLTIKVSPSLSLMLPFCTLSLSVIKSWSSWWNAVLRMFTRKKACVSGYN